jgi:hypothetical protein
VPGAGPGCLKQPGQHYAGAALGRGTWVFVQQTPLCAVLSLGWRGT